MCRPLHAQLMSFLLSFVRYITDLGGRIAALVDYIITYCSSYFVVTVFGILDICHKYQMIEKEMKFKYLTYGVAHVT
jgi:hypothetical protein